MGAAVVMAVVLACLKKFVGKTNVSVNSFVLLWTLCCLRVVLSSVQNEFRVVSGVVWGVLRRRNCYVLCEVVASASAVVVVTPRWGLSSVLLLTKLRLLFVLVALSLWAVGCRNAVNRLCLRWRRGLSACVFANAFCLRAATMSLAVVGCLRWQSGTCTL